MVDKKGNVVNNGDFMVLEEKGLINVFKVEDNKPVIIGDWIMGSLGINESEGMSLEEVPEIMREKVKKHQEKIASMRVKDLLLAPKEIVDVLNKYYDKSIDNNSIEELRVY